MTTQPDPLQAPNDLFRPGVVLMRNADVAHQVAWSRFDNPEHIVEAADLAAIPDALAEIEAATERGMTAAGFLSYEAASAFDPALVTHAASPLPLLWFGLYRDRIQVAPPALPGLNSPPDWRLDSGPEEYTAAIHRIKQYIAAGDTYQVNFTTRMTGAFRDEPTKLFGALVQAQPASYAAYIDTGKHVICSVSPELFFSLDGTRIQSRPMKGTILRGCTVDQDRRQADRLRSSEKDRAENVMIVDMVRNDMGRIADAGTVTVESLYDVERHNTLFQMTSTVHARTRVGLAEIFRALFPCASVTGAPKVRTMQIIRELESTPRGIYTGCIGWIGPGRAARFSVAIRTIHIDRDRGAASYGTGSGIVWDSSAEDEYLECDTKARVLRPPDPPFRLLETLRWEPDAGYYFLDHHMRRLRDSAAYFGFQVVPQTAWRRLKEFADRLPRHPHRIRLTAGRDGTIDVEATCLLDEPFQVDACTSTLRSTACLASDAIDTATPFVYHKTTHRAMYDAHREAHEDVGDIILWNDRGMATETTVGNLVVLREGTFLTPPVENGLLGGSYRASLIEKGTVQEREISCDELRDVDGLFMINSVRGWVRLDLLQTKGNEDSR